MCGITMKQSKIFARTFMCGGHDYGLSIQYQDPISPQNQIDMAYNARCEEYAALSDSLAQARDEQEQLKILEEMDGVFELLQALKAVRAQSPCSHSKQKSTLRKKAAT